MPTDLVGLMDADGTPMTYITGIVNCNSYLHQPRKTIQMVENALCIEYQSGLARASVEVDLGLLMPPHVV